MECATIEQKPASQSYDVSEFDITARAMIVSVHIGLWRAKKKDSDVTDAAIKAYNANAKAGEFTKRLVESDLLKAINTIAGKTYTYIYSVTSPWTGKNERVLNAELYVEFCQKIRGLEAEFMEAVDRFVVEYPQIIEKAKPFLGGMHKEYEYPSPSRIRGEFAFDVSMDTITDSKHIAVKMSREAVNDLAAKIQAKQEGAIRNVRLDCAERVYKAVSAIKERLDGQASAKGKDKIFHDSLLENAQEVIEIVRMLDITNDPRLAQICEDIQQHILRYDAQTLRENPHAKTVTHQEASILLDTIESYMRKK